MEILRSAMDKLTHTKNFLEDFDKEANKMVIKYSPYKSKANEVIAFNWNFEEEFEIWKTKHIDLLDILAIALGK